MKNWMSALGAASALLGTSCANAPEPIAIEHVAIAELRACGVSGVAQDARGNVWAVSESRNELYAFEGERWSAPRRVPLTGVPDELELESIAWLPDGRMLVGTEVEATRDRDTLLVLDVTRDGASVVDRWSVDWRALHGVEARANQGVEGLCAAAGVIVAAGESVTTTEDGRRLAPIAHATVEEAARGRWQAAHVELTSEKGKLSALECRADGAGVVVHAVERHYGVTRVIGFTLDHAGARGEPEPIRPEVVLDVRALLPGIANVEGLAYLDGRLALLNDHDEDMGPGDTEVFVLPRFEKALFARAE